MRLSRIGILSSFAISLALFMPPGFCQPAQPDVDRPGMDYKSLDLPSPDPKLCENACRGDPQNCKAWTYVRPGIQGPTARCWLKSGIASPVRNSCCISGIIQPGSTADEERIAPEQESLDIRRLPKPQAGPRKPEILQTDTPSVQLPHEAQFQAVIARKHQELRAAADLRRKSDLSLREKEIASLMKSNIMAVAPCDPGMENPQVRYVAPAKVNPGDPVLIGGCGFRSREESSEVVLSAAGNPYGIFWNFDTKRPKSYQLEIESWTDTTIKAKIPALEGFGGPIPVKLEVRKGLKLDGDNWVPERVSVSESILLQPEMEITFATSFVHLILPSNPPGLCDSLVDHDVWFLRANEASAIPRVWHFACLNGCQGVDSIQLSRYRLPDNFVYLDWAFSNHCPLSNPGDCALLGKPKLDQDLGSIKGRVTLPDLTVSWTSSPGGPVSYTLMIWVEGPKGISF